MLFPRTNVKLLIFHRCFQQYLLFIVYFMMFLVNWTIFFSKYLLISILCSRLLRYEMIRYYKSRIYSLQTQMIFFFHYTIRYTINKILKSVQKIIQESMIQVIFQIFSIVLPLICVGDELTDILYVFFNWNSFAHQVLLVASIFFIVVPFLVVFILEIIQAYQGNSRTCFLIDTFLVWTKLESWKQCNKKNSDYLQEMRKIVNGDQEAYNNLRKSYASIKMLKYQTLIELFLEDIPQLITQVINNIITNSWDSIEIFSVGFTIIMLTIAVLFIILKIAGVRNFDERNRILQNGYAIKTSQTSLNIFHFEFQKDSSYQVLFLQQ